MRLSKRGYGGQRSALTTGGAPKNPRAPRMTNSTISTPLTTPVILGSGQYGTTLTITATGSVEPGAQAGNAIAIDGPTGIGPVSISNAGSVIGGYTLSSGLGATGISLATRAMVMNTGLIGGGTGHLQNGGAGVTLASVGHVTNSGTIIGGTAFDPNGNTGGVGVLLTAGGSLINSGSLIGGKATGENAQYSYTGTGGTAILLNAAGRVVNTGYVRGGTGEATGAGGVGVALANGDTLINRATITGGPNFAVNQFAGRGGVGVTAGTGDTISNSGTISSGESSGLLPASYAVSFSGSGALINSGVLYGGADLAAGGSVINTGTIEGGAGSQHYSTGLVFSGGGTISNAGTIRGGTFAGVYLNGGTLIAKAGEMDGFGPRGSYSNAVLFGSSASTLTIYPQATFRGNIAANSTADDVLQLAGHTAGQLMGFGGPVRGFTTITEESGAHWLLAGNIALSGTLTVGSHAALQISGSAFTSAIAFATGGASTLTLANPNEISTTFAGFGAADSITLDGIAATSLTYHHGTLTLLNAAHQAVDTLVFKGAYTAADFGLKSLSDGTELRYTGKSIPGTYLSETWHPNAFGEMFILRP